MEQFFTDPNIISEKTNHAITKGMKSVNKAEFLISRKKAINYMGRIFEEHLSSLTRIISMFLYKKPAINGSITEILAELQNIGSAAVMLSDEKIKKWTMQNIDEIKALSSNYIKENLNHDEEPSNIIYLLCPNNRQRAEERAKKHIGKRLEKEIGCDSYDSI